ncbi:conserved hypothetical protein [Theileria orientalis strain Shintoku]|uniref:Uncharacterized protein n=1 Tax=Theileria orientalis strain Shintoku TaxID=869250 RepID=J4C2T7_THEOR|nr:conserved hypothetical protein [Theileria orientalis strain Shintoku]BAM39261.1 conserved hypothetical protein [Theileria orientalis strain Shintoku]|eukprot:XP_009689562.1 conserved hypothetical protein [Theileria orientalis strain Shintoku]
MVLIVPSSVAWPCRKLKPCKNKKPYESVLGIGSKGFKSKNRSVMEDVYVEVELPEDAETITTPTRKQVPQTNENRAYVEEKLKEGGKKQSTDTPCTRNHGMTVIHNYRTNVTNNPKDFRPMANTGNIKRDDDDVETDRRTIEWSLDVVDRYLSRAIDLAKNQSGLNQSNFFHRGGGNDSSKAHTKGAASSFDKYSKVEDSKDIQKDESSFSKNTSQTSVEKSKDEKPKDPNSVGTIEELTRLLFKYHTSRYKEFKRQVYSINDSDAKPGHHSDRHDSTESHPKSYRSNYSYRPSYSRERGHDRHKYKSDR